MFQNISLTSFILLELNINTADAEARQQTIPSTSDPHNYSSKSVLILLSRLLLGLVSNRSLLCLSITSLAITCGQQIPQGEVPGSHGGEYDDGRLLGCLLTFHRCLVLMRQQSALKRRELLPDHTTQHPRRRPSLNIMKFVVV
jgi:hypothetical protein